MSTMNKKSFSELKELVNNCGFTPVVKITLDTESYLEEGMYAKLTGIDFEMFQNNGVLYSFHFDVSEFDGYNKLIETPRYRETESGPLKPASQTSWAYQTDASIYVKVGNDADEFEKPFDIDKDSVKLMEMFKQSDTDNYVTWLEKQVLNKPEIKETENE